jgi:hypothetical protein
MAEAVLYCINTPRSPLIEGLIGIQVSGLVEGLSVETGIFLGDHNVSTVEQRDYQ